MKKIIFISSILISIAILIAMYLAVKKRPDKVTTSTAVVATSNIAVAKPKSSSSASQVPKSIPAAPRSGDQDKVIQEIRSELQSVMDLNEKISGVQQSKSAQILRIQEQAEIHQKILSEIQKVSPQSSSQMPSRETLLAQEKLRIIREETLRNKKLLEDTNRKAAA